jgi:hypothetical protein
MKLKPYHFMPFLFVILFSFNVSSETLPDLKIVTTNELSGASLYLATNKESDPYLIKMLQMGLEKSKLSGEFDMIIGKFNALTVE